MMMTTAYSVLLAALPMAADAAPAQAPAATGRTVLENVPRISYDVHLCPFPGSLFSYLQYVKDPCPYEYLMGVTGAAFRRFWNRDDGGNVDLMYLAPEPYQRICKALGYDYRLTPDRDKAAAITAVKESIGKGRPAFVFGPIGPPEVGLITGYDNGGETLLGWSYFQDGTKPGYFELPGWFEKMEPGVSGAVILLGDKKATRAPERETLISSLEWAADLERTKKRPKQPNHVCGLAAYDGWADGLEVDADYPKDDPKVMETRQMVHGDQCVMLHERNDAAKYLRSMLAVAPEAAETLGRAAAFYEQAANEGGPLWPQARDIREVFADPKARREMAAHVRLAKEAEEMAVGQLEAALKILKGAPGQAKGD